MRQRAFFAGLLLALGMAVGCGSDPAGSALPIAGAGAGIFGGTAGVDGFSPPQGTGGTAGFAGTGAGFGAAGVDGFAGAGGSGGAGGFGGDGAAGAAGLGGAGMGAAGTGGGIMRGPAPTESTASAKGPYTVMTYTNGFKMPSTYGGATIYYPTGADAPFGMVVVCPGFTALQSSIAGWGSFLASHGIVTMTIDTKTTGDSVTQRADELMEALDGLKAENTRMGSPLFGKLDVMRAGLMGWSMGGGGTWISSSKHPELKTAISLAGHNSTAGGTASSPNIKVPTLLCAGSADTPILGGAMSQPVYAAIPETTPKMIYEIQGGDHNVCNNPLVLGREYVGRYGLAWQKVFLEGDDRYRQFLLVAGPNASTFMTNVK